MVPLVSYLEWIRRWLTDRKQRVILNGETSDWLPVLSGVVYHKGLLGLVLFQSYINDIDLNISGEMLKFADDIKVICLTIIQTLIVGVGVTV